MDGNYFVVILNSEHDSNCERRHICVEPNRSDSGWRQRQQKQQVDPIDEHWVLWNDKINEIHESTTCPYSLITIQNINTAPHYLWKEKCDRRFEQLWTNTSITRKNGEKNTKNYGETIRQPNRLFCYFSFLSRSLLVEQQARTFNSTDEQLNTIVSFALLRLWPVCSVCTRAHHTNFPRRYSFCFFFFFFTSFSIFSTISAHIFDNSHKHIRKSLAAGRPRFRIGCVRQPRRQYRAVCEWATNVKTVHRTTKSCHFFLSQTNEWNE